MVSSVEMNQALNAYNTIGRMATDPVQLTPDAQAVSGPSFSELMGQIADSSIKNVYKSDAVSTATLTGKAGLNDLVQAVANAELTVQTVVAIRDRVISAYQDIIRMPI
jgi:flagellar hook-basal body complex protein FliE